MGILDPKEEEFLRVFAGEAEEEEVVGVFLR
jgi:hypothetical protein